MTPQALLLLAATDSRVDPAQGGEEIAEVFEAAEAAYIDGNRSDLVLAVLRLAEVWVGT